MSTLFRNNLVCSAIVAALVLSFSSTASAVDAEAAKTLARQNNCFKCHAVDKKKDGPTYKEVAAKYRDKTQAAAEARLITHITTGEKAKFPDGHEEDHVIIKTKDMDQIKNLVNWILTL